MRWILLDVAIALLALGLLAVLVLGLWRRVKGLSREVGRAGELVGRATEDLARLQAAGPHGSPAYIPPPPVPAPIVPASRSTAGRHRSAPR